MKTETAIVDFIGYDISIAEVCNRIMAGTVLRDQKNILIKPNLVTDAPYPVTTSPLCCSGAIDYIRSHTDADIVIAEGTGNPRCSTMETFDRLGYTRLAREKGVELVDLNTAPTIRLRKKECSRFPEFHIPEIALDHFIVSIPVLKAHSLSKFTGTMKNMIGFAPPEHYSGSGGIWNKAEFHIRIDQAIIDANRYRHADLTIFDAVTGLSEYHLGGPQCNPPVGKMLAGFDPVDIDRQAAGLLGLDWKTIAHLSENHF